jgi:phosphatidylserine/phosphatidylglycerophosphate/cardiolipin synthase-like enzyme
MARLKLSCALALGAVLLLAGCEPQASIPQGIQVYFSPHGGCTEAVVNALNQATNSVLVQAYSFTSAPIAKALVEAHRRGVQVQVILDHSQRTEKYSEADFLKNNAIPTLIDAQHAIAHNKIMIIDGYVVLTGSFNFTKAAEEHNAENLLVINDPALAEKYIANWHAHEQHSEPYERSPRPSEHTNRPKRN